MRGYTMDKDNYRRRLKRVEGQVRGLERMIEEDQYCIDVLTQISAVTSALRSISLGLLDEHVRHCVASAEGEESEEKITEAITAVARIVRS
jgi:DNA-binding FrmR family transcriptional regulator